MTIFCHPPPKPTPFPTNPRPQPASHTSTPSSHTMATTFLDLPADVWGKVASALPEIRGAAPLHRFSLALTHKDLCADLFRSDTGAAWQQCMFYVGRGHEAAVAAHARSVEQLVLLVKKANSLGPAARMLRGMNKLRKITIVVDEVATADAAIIALLPIVAEHWASVDALGLYMPSGDERLVPTCLPRLVARNRAVGALVHRLDALHVAGLPSAAFLRGATLSRLAFAGTFPTDMPHLPSIVRVDMEGVARPPRGDPFADDAHAQRTARALPRLATLQLFCICIVVTPHLATFLRLVKPSLKRIECHNVIIFEKAEAAWPTGMDELALTDVWAYVQRSLRYPPAGTIKLDVGVLATQPLTRLVFFKSDECAANPVRLIATPSAWSFPALKHLDLRDCRPCSYDDGTLKAPRGLPLPLVPAGALASLHTLLVGYASVDAANVFDVGEFSRWDAAPRLAILVVERARLVASRRAAAVAPELAKYKPVLASVHLHECSVADDVMAAVAVGELVRGRERVCRCPRVGECLFGLDWWETHGKMLY